MPLRSSIRFRTVTDADIVFLGETNTLGMATDGSPLSKLGSVVMIYFLSHPLDVVRTQWAKGQEHFYNQALASLDEVPARDLPSLKKQMLSKLRESAALWQAQADLAKGKDMTHFQASRS